jgi:ATP-dependent DNA helicase RecQ
MHILQTLPEHPPILATTATANNRVIQDVAQIIGQNTVIVRGSLTRSSLSLHIYNEPQPASYRMALVAELLGRLEGSGIIYCTTTRDCRLVSDYLNQQGHETHPYYSNVEELGYEREDLERALLENDVKALVASVALGMGFDKPDLGFVIHYQHPNSIIAYYQQIGRAGRGIDNAYIILLHGMEDLQIQEYFIENAFPTRQQVREVLQVLRDKGISKLSDISTQVNIRKSVLDNILTHLEVEGIVHYEVQNRTYRLLDAQREPDYARWASVTEQRYGELKQMTDYYQHEGCLMHYIATLLEDPHPVKHCGKCQNCLKRKPHTTPTEAQKKFAEEFLDTGDFMMLKPRKQWATSLKQEDAELSGRIAEDLRNAEGYILSSYFDDVWGRYVREGKYHHQHFDDALVEESARRLQPVIQEKGIAWITNIGSLRHPDLVPSFARRLAQQLSLPYYVCQDNLRERPEQKTMQNSHHQVKNLLNTFTIQKDLPQAPVLLVDDIVDSGWTLTVVGYKLRQAGCEAVYPFALATTKR